MFFVYSTSVPNSRLTDADFNYAVNVLFPFVAFMVEYLHHGGLELGYYAGGLAASFCGAQFFSSILWGMISDRYGRKPAITIGTLGTAVGMIIFGCAKTYTAALVGRVISGLLSGNLGVLKSFLTEITDESNRGAGFSYMSVAWALGTIIAPLAGGLLCNPANKYPKYFSDTGLFGIHPYLLPCLICVVFNVVTALVCQLFMVETRQPNQVENKSIKKVDVIEGSMTRQKCDEKSEESDGKCISMKPLEVSDEDIILRPSSGFLNRAVDKFEKGLQTSRTYMQQKWKVAKGSDDRKQYSALNAHGPSDETDDDDTAANCSKMSACTRASGSSTSLDSMGGTTVEGSDYDGALPRTKSAATLESLTDSDSGGDIHVDESVESDDDSDDDHCECCNLMKPSIAPSSSKTDRRSRNNKYDALPDPNGNQTFVIEIHDDDVDDISVIRSDSTDNLEYAGRDDKKKRKNTVKKSALTKKSVILVTCNYGLLAMAFIIWEETIPLFLKLDNSQGGFGLGSSDIGFLLSSSGGVMLVFTYIALPTLARRSKKWLFCLGVYCAMPITFAIPILATAKALFPAIFESSGGKSLLWTLLILCCVLKNISACIAFTA
jgi:Major Facilitator Superfamily